MNKNQADKKEKKENAIILGLLIATCLSVFGGAAILTWFPSLLSEEPSALSYLLYAIVSAIAIADFLCIMICPSFFIMAVAQSGIVGMISQHIWHTILPTIAVFVIPLAIFVIRAISDLDTPHA